MYTELLQKGFLEAQTPEDSALIESELAKALEEERCYTLREQPELRVAKHIALCLGGIMLSVLLASNAANMSLSFT